MVRNSAITRQTMGVPTLAQRRFPIAQANNEQPARKAIAYRVTPVNVL